MIRALGLLLAVALVVGAGIYVYDYLENLVGTLSGRALGQWDAPVSDDTIPRAFVVRPGESATQIGEALYAQGLIRSPVVFRVMVESRGVGDRIGAGEYQLSPAMTTSEVVTVLSRGAVARGVALTIPEGWRSEQVAQKIESLSLARADDLMVLIREGAPHADPAVSGLVPPGQSLEGYLFPDTYEIDPKLDARALVQLLTRHFNSKFGPELQQRASAAGLTPHQVITIASIIEREAANPGERPIIASVYLNRLRINMPLQADPTVQFAVASANLAQAFGAGFWKRELTRSDLQLNSPYNTYIVRGLPPGPICSPGLDSILAAINPSQTDYLYFVAKGDGTHEFARTEPEHRANVERYQRSGN